MSARCKKKSYFDVIELMANDKMEEAAKLYKLVRQQELEEDNKLRVQKRKARKQVKFGTIPEHGSNWEGEDKAMKQQTLFPLPKPRLVMTIQDVATTDDPLENHLERKGWDLKKVRELQNDISARLTIDIFNGETRELSPLQKQLQNDIQEFLDRQRYEQRRKEKTG